MWSKRQLYYLVQAYRLPYDPHFDDMLEVFRDFENGRYTPITCFSEEPDEPISQMEGDQSDAYLATLDAFRWRSRVARLLARISRKLIRRWPARCENCGHRLWLRKVEHYGLVFCSSQCRDTYVPF